MRTVQQVQEAIAFYEQMIAADQRGLAKLREELISLEPPFQPGDRIRIKDEARLNVERRVLGCFYDQGAWVVCYFYGAKNRYGTWYDANLASDFELAGDKVA